MTRFPIGFWNYAPIAKLGPASVTDWADAGMTLTLGPEFGPEPADLDRMRAILDAAAERHIRVILCHAHSYSGALTRDGETVYRRQMEAAAAALGSHPAVFGFHVGDEPDAKHFADFCRALRIQKEVAPRLTPFGNLLPWHPGCEPRVGFADWAAYLDAYVEAARPDLLCYDCYSQLVPDPENSSTGFDMYFRNLREYQAASARHGIPYWTTLLSAGHFHYRCPTEDDLRWQLNTAAAHGAKGLLYFFFYMREPHGNYRVPPMDEHYERTATFSCLSRVNRTFLNTTAPLFARLSLRRVSHAGRAFGGVPLFDGSGRVSRAEGGNLVVSEFAAPDGAVYVFVVNNSQTANVEPKLWIRGRRPAAWHVRWQGREELAAGGPERRGQCGEDFCAFRHWLSPGQGELYRIAE